MAPGRWHVKKVSGVGPGGCGGVALFGGGWSWNDTGSGGPWRHCIGDPGGRDMFNKWGTAPAVLVGGGDLAGVEFLAVFFFFFFAD